jgi:hypothetical protein
LFLRIGLSISTIYPSQEGQGMDLRLEISLQMIATRITTQMSPITMYKVVCII